MRNTPYTFSQYKALDLLIFAFLAILFEALITFAASNLFPTMYTLSLLTPIVCLVYMRWGGYGVIHAVLCGAAYCTVYLMSDMYNILDKMLGESLDAIYIYLIFCIGNAFTALSIIYLKLLGKQRVRDSLLLTILYVVIVFLLAQIGKTIVAVICGEPIGIFINFITNDSISIIFALIAVLICRKLDGMLEDQKTYLIRMQKKREEEKG